MNKSKEKKGNTEFDFDEQIKSLSHNNIEDIYISTESVDEFVELKISIKGRWRYKNNFDDEEKENTALREKLMRLVLSDKRFSEKIKPFLGQKVLAEQYEDGSLVEKNIPIPKRISDFDDWLVQDNSAYFVLSAR